ncbi:MAG: nucleotidyltransferase domain-containing protein [candidate division NC10 bacterium]|nr:nucleotidyltransferase domain-containing protein [candidate division NC10 bacterium]
MNAVALKDMPGFTDQEEAALTDLVNVLVTKHGRAVRLLTLFGSKARGEGGPMSDIDVLVVVAGDRWQMSEDIHDVTHQIIRKYDYLIPLSLSVLSEGEYDLISKVGTSFYRNLEKDGIALWKSSHAALPPGTRVVVSIR